MSETSAGHDTTARTMTAGAGGPPRVTALQELAIEYKTSIAASIGGAAGALIGYCPLSRPFWLTSTGFHWVSHACSGFDVDVGRFHQDSTSGIQV